MTKKVVRLTESDLEKIVRRVIKESMGVAFGGEQNGLKIKKMDAKEQVVATPPTGNVSAQPKPVDQAIMSKIKGTFPAPMKDDMGKLTFGRTQSDSGKYDTIVKYLATKYFLFFISQLNILLSFSHITGTRSGKFVNTFLDSSNL